MGRVGRIARTEIAEHRRQPWMLFILALNYVLWLFIFSIVFKILGSISGDGVLAETLRAQLVTQGVELSVMLKTAATTYASLMFTNLPLYVAIMSGTSVLHDRESGTMPFLLLAPISRHELLVGKLLGAAALPVVMHLLFVGAGSLLIGGMHGLEAHAEKLGGAAAWWIAFLIGAPVSALFVGALGTVISALSRDVRTAMQYTSFFIGLLSLGIAFVLVEGIARGTGLQIGYAIAAGVGTLLVLLLGAWLVSKDVSIS